MRIINIIRGIHETIFDFPLAISLKGSSPVFANSTLPQFILVYVGTHHICNNSDILLAELFVIGVYVWNSLIPKLIFYCCSIKMNFAKLL